MPSPRQTAPAAPAAATARDRTPRATLAASILALHMLASCGTSEVPIPSGSGASPGAMDTGWSTVFDVGHASQDVTRDATSARPDTACIGPDCPGGEEPSGCNPALDPNCPCEPEQLRLCSSHGDPLTMGAATWCKPGFQRCLEGRWEQTCHGELGPREEACNGIDDDCDGELDEGLRDQGNTCPGQVLGPPADVCTGTQSEGSPGDLCSCALPEELDDPSVLRRNQPCYTGPSPTLGVGICRGGVRDCRTDGTWGTCAGQVLPQNEVCGDQLDNDCNGIIDDGCPGCPPGIADCDQSAQGGGLVQLTCPDGRPFNGCGGCGPVSPETCGDGLDNNCNGLVDEGCPCTSTSQLCYPGPPEKSGIGICKKGEQVCSGEFWGGCTDYTLPMPLELCGPDGTGNGLDDNCDGNTDEGCGCQDGQTRPCGSSTGECRAGARICSRGQWSECQGAVGPASERCDGLDNDCNGIADDGLLNACGTCEESCYTQIADPVTTGRVDEGAEIIADNDPDNPRDRPGLTLAKRSFFPPYLWAANTSNDSVSKFNTDTGIEEGRYWVGQSPSRTAVDLDGNMWVVGRNDGRLTKVLWDPANCPGNNTSAPLPGGGASQLNSAAAPLADNCVVYSENPTLNANIQHNSGRGLAVDPNGNIWVGYADGNGGIQSVHPHTFAASPVYPTLNLPVYAPDANGVQRLQTDASGNPVTTNAGTVYGLVGDSQGNLYASVLWQGRGLPRFNTRTRQWDAYFTGFNCATYGIAVDGRDRVFLGCGNPGWAPNAAAIGGGIAMFDPATNAVTRFFIPGAFQSRLPQPGEQATASLGCQSALGCAERMMVTAVAVEPATGNVWATFYNLGYVGRLEINEQDLSQSRWTFIAAIRNPDNSVIPGISLDMRGIGFDRLGYAWHLGMGTSSVIKIDPATNERIAVLPLGVGGHYTYSDFTGSTAFSFTAPRGYWRYYFQTGFPTARLDALLWEAYVPVDTSLGVRVRALNRDGNPVSGWIPQENAGIANYLPYPVGLPQDSIDLAGLSGPLQGSIFEVELRLTSNNRDARPILYDLRLEWQRP